MGKKSTKFVPETLEILSQMGKQIHLARLRRNLSITAVAEKAGISRITLAKIEKGSPSVAIGSYAAVLHILDGLDMDFLLIAAMDGLDEKNNEAAAKNSSI